MENKYYIIYKFTNKVNGKIYIGLTNRSFKTRKYEHILASNKSPKFKFHQAIKKYGIDNFNFHVLIICFDEDRYKYEIEYIKKYNSIVPNGYNILEGGPGGSFEGKKHSEETKTLISKCMKQKYIDNPELKKEMSERNKIVMNSEIIKNKISQGMLNSKKYQQMIKDKKVGNINNKCHTEESKNKIRESIKKYHNENIIKHREAMSKSIGIKICQHDLNNVLINNFVSFADASRQTGVPSSTIKKCVKNNTINRGFIWKKE